MKIFLADLTYDTIKTNYTMPLNIGFIGSVIKERFGHKVDLSLYKYPTILDQTLDKIQPDILGLSHYSWNSRLNRVFLQKVKRMNPDTITVMGGPNISTDPSDIKKFLFNNPLLDYYILNEGEDPFAELVNNLLLNRSSKIPKGCAKLINGELHYDPIDFKSKEKVIDNPSPYLSGLLDDFLQDDNFIPMLESNRGCPYKCVYCAWGASALSKIRTRPLDQVYQEIDYIAKSSSKKSVWIFCDANFGILKRDIDIAKSLRRVMKKNGIPYELVLWDSKNSSQRNIDIAKIIGNENRGLLAVQSLDEKVLLNSGRGNIKLSHFKKQISFYHENKLETETDILIGLPGESAESHLNTLKGAFDMGFDWVIPTNIRLIEGTEYAEKKFRDQYQIKTKFRPIFGAYGTYDGKMTFEVEESVRATKDMTEEELNHFKIYHWMIGFLWSGNILKPILKLGYKHGVNPVSVFDRLINTNNQTLKNLFKKIEDESMKEWFDTSEEIVAYYEKPTNFNKLKNFMKLYFLYIALVYQDSNLIKLLTDTACTIIANELKKKNQFDEKVFFDMKKINDLLVCKDLLTKEVSTPESCLGINLALILGTENIDEIGIYNVEIYRPQSMVDFCNSELMYQGSPDLSLQNMVRFLERKGLDLLVNRIRVVN